MSIDLELLISAVQERPCIWDKALSDYKDRNLTGKGWQEVCRLMNPDFDQFSPVDKKNFEKEILRRWKTLRDGFRKSLERVRRAKRSGAPASKIRKYVYNDQLQFLSKLYTSRDTEDTIESGNESADESRPVSDDEVSQIMNQAVDEQTENTEQPRTSSEILTGTQRSSVPDKIPAGPRSKKKRQSDEIEQRLLKAIETPNRHISFIQGLLPSLDALNDEQVLEFQMGVLQLIKKIKNPTFHAHSRPYSASSFDYSSSHSSQHLHFPRTPAVSEQYYVQELIPHRSPTTQNNYRTGRNYYEDFSLQTHDVEESQE